jgi:hypothetical protein
MHWYRAALVDNDISPLTEGDGRVLSGNLTLWIRKDELIGGRAADSPTHLVKIRGNFVDGGLPGN